MRSLTKATYIAASALGVLVVAWLAFRQSQVAVGPVPQAVPSTSTTIAPGSSVPKGVDPGFDAGIAALEAGQTEEALARFEAVSASSPAYPLARMQVGVVQARQGDLEAAGRTFAELTGLVPDVPDPWLRLAEVRIAQGRHDAAEIALLRVVELAPNDVTSRYDLGLVRLAQGRTNEAIGAYVRAMKVPVPSEQQRSYVLDAIERVERLLASHPDRAELHYALAFFANSIGRREIEIEELELFLASAQEGPFVDRAREQLRAARERGTAPPR